MTATASAPNRTRPAADPPAFDVGRVRADFPILHQKIHGKPLVYLDNAASTQKPQCVVDAIRRYYEGDNANVHRGIHELSDRATRQFEAARVKVQKFLNAADSREIVFVKGTTDAINLVAASFGRSRVGPGDEVLITWMEHHSNIVPWQMLCAEKGAHLRVAPIDDRGDLILEEFERLLTPRTKIVSVAHVSNTLGTVNPVRTLVDMCRRRGIPILLDGAQSTPHFRVDVRDLDCDFFAFSGHKVYGPTGVGVLYGKLDLLEAMPPYQGGGDMIDSVAFEGTTYNVPPHRFEAGTPNIAGVIGLGAALDYLEGVGRDAVERHETELLAYAIERLGAIDGLRQIGTARQRAGAISFVVDGLHASDVGTILDREGIAVRTGHHCTQPLMKRFGVPATVRAALAMYNTRAEVDALVAGIHKARKLFG